MDKSSKNTKSKALFRINHLQIRVILQCLCYLGCVKKCHTCFSVEQGILCIVILDHADIRCKLFQSLTGLGDHIHILFIHAFTHGKLCDSCDYTIISDDGHTVFQRFIPEIFVSLDINIYLIRIVNDQRDSCTIRHGVLIIRIIELPLEKRIDVSEIGNSILVDLLDKSFFYRTVDNVIICNYHIVITTFCLGKFLKHGLIGIKVRIDNLGSCFFFKIIQHFLRNHSVPCIKYQFIFILCTDADTCYHSCSKCRT